MNLPTSGRAWENMKAAADGSFSEVKLADQNTQHDAKVLAAALVNVRTKDERYRKRAIEGLMAIIGTEDNHDSHCDKSSRPKEYGNGPQAPA